MHRTLDSDKLADHPVVSRKEWLRARKALLKQEKALTHQYDKIVAKRRELPWVKVDKDYHFQGPDGTVSLAGLFQGRSQLILQHFMFGPDWKEGCVGCSFEADGVDAGRRHFEHRDASFAAVSRAPYEKLAAFKKRMGWDFAWVSSFGSDFNYDFGVSVKPEQMGQDFYYNYEMEKAEIDELPGISVFYKDPQGTIFHTYSVYGRGVENLDVAYMYLDLTPKGRDEEDLEQPGSWWRHHDKYETDAASACCQGAKSEEKSACCA